MAVASEFHLQALDIRVTVGTKKAFNSKCNSCNIWIQKRARTPKEQITYQPIFAPISGI